MSATPQQRSGVFEKLTDNAKSLLGLTARSESKSEEMQDQLQLFAANTRVLSSQITNKIIPEKTPVKDTAMNIAYQELEEAKKNHSEKIVSQARLNRYEDVINKIDILLKKGHSNPKGINLVAEREYINSVRMDLYFLNTNGTTWQKYLKPLQQAEKDLERNKDKEKIPSLMADLKRVYLLAQEYCNIKNKYNLFDKNESFASHVVELQHFKEILVPPKHATDETSQAATSWLINPLEIPAKISGYLWPTPVTAIVPPTEKVAEQKKEVRKKPHIARFEEDQDMYARTPSKLDLHSTSVSAPSRQTMEMKSIKPKKNKDCCDCACLSSFAFFSRKQKTSEEIDTDYHLLDAPKVP
ncbi:MAG: hypothetical protein ACYCQI_13425 [Gammaproteobacteria bacterium]